MPAKKTTKQESKETSKAEVISYLEKNINDFKAYVNENIAGSRFRQRNWSIPGVAERDIPRFDREKCIEYARQYVESWPIVAGLIQTLTDNIVGSGYRLSVMTKDASWNNELEAYWDETKDSLDIRGLRTWGQLQRLWYTRKTVDGDVGIYLYPSTDQFFLQTIEAERIRQRKYDYLDQGLKIDEFGRIKSVFVGPRPKDQMDWEKILKEGREIDAKDFIFYAHFSGDRADQIRGTSALLQNFNLFRDIAEIMQAVVQKIKNEAFIALVFTLEQSAGGSFFGSQIENTRTAEDGKKRKHVKLVPGMNLTPAPGEKVDLLGMKTPNDQLMPFIRFLLRYSGTAFGLPLEMLLMDVSETNFSGGRVILELAKKRFRVEQDSLCKVSSRAAKAAIDFAIANKKLKPPKALSEKYFTHRWGRPVAPYLDPYKEATANELNLKNKLTSPQLILADSSEVTAEDVLDQWAQFLAMCKEKNVPSPDFGVPKTQDVVVIDDEKEK